MRTILKIRPQIAFFVLIITIVSAQDQEERVVAAAKFSQPPTIDGQITEDIWQIAQPIERFIQFQPEHGQPSALRTVAYIGYDSEALYVAVMCYDPAPDEIAAAQTKRDSDLDKDDAISVLLDTFNDDRTCTGFATNSIGTQKDFRVTDNGRTSDGSWDAAWSSAAARTTYGWSAELAIPFTSIKFQAGEGQSWGINIGRSYPRNLELSSWAGPLDSQYRVSQFGELSGLDLGNSSKRYEIIPYALSQALEDKELEGRAGLDLRYRVSSNLGAEVTVNPDFATVEADAEQINLTRFELGYPEKRPFFLEGAEMFKQRVRQFYSRRIGDIPWGAKLSGKVGSYDLSVMGAQSEPLDGKSAADYTIIRTKKGLFGASNVGFLVANRHLGSNNQGSIGMDGTFFFTKTLGLTTQFVRAHGPENDGALTWFVRPAFDNATSHFHVRYSNWDKGLMENMNTVGFIRDDDRKEFDTNLSHTFWMPEGAVEKIDAGINYNRYWSQAGALRSWELEPELVVVFKSKWELELTHSDEFKRYEKGFRNRITELELKYDTRTGRSVRFNYGLGRNFDSDLQIFRATTDLKISDAWNMSYGLIRLWLDPEPEDEADGSTFIHVLRSNYYLNKDLYLKLLYQTNSASGKENAQAVMVWRFLPPFGSLQFAYQNGSSRIGAAAGQGQSLFVKLAWVI